MTDTPTTPDVPLPDGPSRLRPRSVRRRWPFIAIAVVLVIAALWAFTRKSSSSATATEPSNTATTATNDSVVTLDSAGQRLAGIDLLTVTPSTSSTLMTNGTITFDANRVSVISSRAEGRVVSVRADLGQSVAAGAVLATVQSAEVGATRGDLERARVGVDVARRNYEREQRLFEEQITPQKELLEAEAAYRTAQADFNSAASKLSAVGATEGSGATFGLVTPVGGTIVERNASPGQVVGPTTNLFTVADLRHVWITIDVYEKDLARVRQGAQASVVPSALSTESFPGHVTYAGGIVDSATRTFKVRVEVENTALRLRPGMFAQVRIQTPAAGGTSVIVVPEVAVQDLNGNPIVFVMASGASGATARYVVRHVTVGPRVGDGTVVITDGLRAGERIVGKGAFQLKSELTKASFGDED